VAYATPEELASALRIAVTPANQDALLACLDAAALEIDDAIDRVDPAEPLPTGQEPLANRVNIVRGVEWWKSNDAAFGVIGSTDTGALRAPRDGFYRHRLTLIPLKQQFGVA
jgi:hypothetical protein